MANFSIFFPILLKQEGYYANKPGDSGGETWEGIARNYYPAWSGWAIVDSYKSQPNFPTSLRADQNLANSVYAFYKSSQWDPLKGDSITNQSIANYIADWGVNAGLSTPVKHAQQIVGTTVDGKMGPATLAAINSADGATFFAALKAARIQFYHDVVTAHPEDRQFLSDWLARANYFTYA
jgi:lysozyme family protein